jgi:hypothetical protein
MDVVVLVLRPLHTDTYSAYTTDILKAQQHSKNPLLNKCIIFWRRAIIVKENTHMADTTTTYSDPYIDMAGTSTTRVLRATKRLSDAKRLHDYVENDKNSLSNFGRDRPTSRDLYC